MVQSTGAAPSPRDDNDDASEPPQPSPAPDLRGWRLRPLTLADKPLYDQYLGLVDRPLASQTFANTVVWGAEFRFSYAVIRDCLCVFRRSAGGLELELPPLGETGRAAAAFAECGALLQDDTGEMPNSSVVNSIHGELAAALGATPVASTRFALEPAAPDFIYTTRDLIDLRGARYKSKRNDINQLERAYPDLAVTALRPAHREDVAALCRTWIRQRRVDQDPRLATLAQAEFDAILRAVRDMERLELVGLRLDVAGAMAAFTLGERLPDGNGHVIFEKSRLDVRGAAQMIFRELCRSLGECPQINAGDDLGCPDLGRAKQSYRPVELRPSFTARLTRRPAMWLRAAAPPVTSGRPTP